MKNVILMDARDWELYTCDADKLEASEDAAKVLSATIISASDFAKRMVAAGVPRKEAATFAFNEWYGVAIKLRSTGAADTEPRCIAADILDDALGIPR